MTIGIVKWFDEDKGFGFIQRSDGPDVFCYFKAIAVDGRYIRANGRKTLHEGDEVKFEIVEGEKGPEARQVFRIS